MQKHSLTLCLVFSDDEETIGRTLKSVLAAVDEVVAVDLGAKDNTRLIVEGYGARIVDTEWSESGAAARNAALDAAFGDWILVMEPGEVLESVGPVDLGRLLAEKGPLGYYLRVQGEDRRGQVHLRDELRLFRNLTRARFRYRVDEQVAPALAEIAHAEGGDFRPTSLRLRRPAVDETNAGADQRRRLTLLRRALQEQTTEPWYPFRLASATAMAEGGELLPVKGFSTVLRSLEEAHRLLEEGGGEDAGEAPAPPWGDRLYAMLSQARRAVGRWAAARDAAERGLQIWGDSSRLRYEQAVSILSCAAAGGNARRGATDGSRVTKRDRKRAVRNLESLLDGPRQIERVEVERAHFHSWPRVWLGRAALVEGETARARAFFQEALEENPKEAAAWCGLAEAAAAEGRQRAALQIYLKALDATQLHAASWEGGIRVLEDLAFLDNAWSWMQRLALLLPEYHGLAALEERLIQRRRQAQTAGV